MPLAIDSLVGLLAALAQRTLTQPVIMPHLAAQLLEPGRMHTLPEPQGQQAQHHGLGCQQACPHHVAPCRQPGEPAVRSYAPGIYPQQKTFHAHHKTGQGKTLPFSG